MRVVLHNPGLRLFDSCMHNEPEPCFLPKLQFKKKFMHNTGRTCEFNKSSSLNAKGSRIMSFWPKYRRGVFEWRRSSIFPLFGNVGMQISRFIGRLLRVQLIIQGCLGSKGWYVPGQWRAGRVFETKTDVNNLIDRATIGWKLLS